MLDTLDLKVYKGEMKVMCACKGDVAEEADQRSEKA